jgi:ubiquinone/menaquinone biosynthesis C-methylase UbiE
MERTPREHVFPWWMGFVHVSPLRRLLTNPVRLLAPYVSAGMTVLEPGPGMGFFTLELARRVGPAGRIVAVDVQTRVLDALRRRARRAGLLDRIETRRAHDCGLGVEDLAGKVDFILAFAVVHEIPDKDRFFSEAASVSKRGTKMLFCEPSSRVTEDALCASLALAVAAGLRVQSRPVITGGRSAVLVKD